MLAADTATGDDSADLRRAYRRHDLPPCAFRTLGLAGHGFGNSKKRRSIFVYDVPQAECYQSERLGEGQCLIERFLQIRN